MSNLQETYFYLKYQISTRLFKSLIVVFILIYLKCGTILLHFVNKMMTASFCLQRFSFFLHIAARLRGLRISSAAYFLILTMTKCDHAPCPFLFNYTIIKVLQGCAKYTIISSDNILRISRGRVFVNYVMVLSCCRYLHHLTYILLFFTRRRQSKSKAIS